MGLLDDVCRPSVVPIVSAVPSSGMAVVIFAARESLPRLRRTVEAAVVAAHGLARVEVMVNGNHTLAQELVQCLKAGTASGADVAVRVWGIPLADKANAWNQYMHMIWAGEELVFFMDGYVSPNPDAFRLLGAAMRAHPKALAGTGLPTTGRTAAVVRQDLLEWGGLHGNLCCVSAPAILQFRARGIFIPLGHYRTDALMASILYFGLDPEGEGWEWYRIHAEAAASWTTDARRWWRLSDLRDSVGRRFRQARGLLENKAVQEHLDTRRQAPATLPAASVDLVLNWIDRCPKDARAVWSRHPLAYFAWRHLRGQRTRLHASPSPRQLWPLAEPTAAHFLPDRTHTL